MNLQNRKTSSNADHSSQIEIGHPVHNEPALILEGLPGINGNVLILADLHYGIEYSLAKAGARLPSQTEKITEHVLKLCSKFNVSQLILLGDIKHTIPVTSRQEWRELPKVFTRLAQAVDAIEIIPGNHDGNLRKLIPDNLKQVHIHPISGTVLHGLGFFHGHTWPAAQVIRCAQVLMAHNHPNVLFVDKLGGRVSYSCWVRCRLDIERVAERYSELNNIDPEIIIMPALNDIGSGTPVNTAKPEFLGPMLKNRYIDLDSARVYLLDGTDIGMLRELIDLSSASKHENNEGITFRSFKT